jgi:hypothetical protein
MISAHQYCFNWPSSAQAQNWAPYSIAVKPVHCQPFFAVTTHIIISNVSSALLRSSAGLNLGSIGVETDRRGFVPVSDKMEVLGKDGKVVPNVYCIGDANGKYMLAHAASAQVRRRGVYEDSITACNKPTTQRGRCSAATKRDVHWCSQRGW